MIKLFAMARPFYLAAMVILVGCVGQVFASPYRYGIDFQNIGTQSVFDFRVYYGDLGRRYSRDPDWNEDPNRRPLFKAAELVPKIGGGDGIAMAFTSFGPPLEVSWTPKNGERRYEKVDVAGLMSDQTSFWGYLEIEIDDDRLFVWAIHQNHDFDIFKCQLLFDSASGDASAVPRKNPDLFCPGEKLFRGNTEKVD